MTKELAANALGLLIQATHHLNHQGITLYNQVTAELAKLVQEPDAASGKPSADTVEQA